MERGLPNRMNLLRIVLFRSLAKTAHYLFDGGKSSFSFAGTRFLNAAEARRVISQDLIYEGDDHFLAVPALKDNQSAFFSFGQSVADHLKNLFKKEQQIKLSKPFTLRLQKKPGERFFESEGTLLIKKRGSSFLLAPEFRASLNLLTPFKGISKNSFEFVTSVSSWRSYTYGDFGLLMLPKWARLSNHCDELKTRRNLLRIPDIPFLSSWGDHFKFKTISHEFGSKSLHEVFSEATLLYGPGAMDGFICHPSDLSRLRNSVIPRLRSSGQLKLYICRAGRRKPSNQKEIQSLLASHNFIIIEDRYRSIYEQAEMFFNASFIVAPHGAALANLAFCKQGTKVLEFLPGRYPSQVFRQLCALNQLEYSCMICGNLEKHHDSAVNDDYSVDLSQLKLAISKMLR